MHLSKLPTLYPFLTLLTTALTSPLHPTTTPTPFYTGHDISSLPLLTTYNYTYRSLTNTTLPLYDILASGGANSYRLRIWVNPSDGIYGLDYNLAFASELAAKGYSIYLDFHFSDTWADPHHQVIPAAWPQDNLTELAGTLRGYVSDTLESFQTAGVLLEIVSLGNEIRRGTLWPVGEVDVDLDEGERVANFTNLATLWKAAREGVSDAVGAGVPKPQVMIHIDDGWNLTLQESWFGALTGTGLLEEADWDIFGFSFYPFYGTAATLANLQDSLDSIAQQYGKPVHVVETDWPDLCPNVSTVDGGELSEPEVPVSVAGQTEWVQDVVKVVKGVPDALGAGVWYWEPAWLNNTGLGSNCSDAILFDGDYSDWPDSVVGYARSSINMFLGV